MKDVLVVYYSRTGTTHRVAEAIAAFGGWDLEPLVDMRSRRGLVGYLRAGFDAMLGRRTPIGRTQHDPADYRLVVVGGPIWDGNVSAAVRTWLEDYRDRIARAAFFVTCGGRGQRRVFQRMRELLGAEPVAVLALTDRDVDDQLAERAHAFVEELRVVVERAQTPPLEPAPPPLA